MVKLKEARSTINLFSRPSIDKQSKRRGMYKLNSQFSQSSDSNGSQRRKKTAEKI